MCRHIYIILLYVLVIRDAAGRNTGGALSESLNFAYLIRAHPRHPRNLCSKSFATGYINQIELTVSGLLFPAGGIRKGLYCEHGYLGLWNSIHQNKRNADDADFDESFFSPWVSVSPLESTFTTSSNSPHIHLNWVLSPLKSLLAMGALNLFLDDAEHLWFFHQDACRTHGSLFDELSQIQAWTTFSIFLASIIRSLLKHPPQLVEFRQIEANIACSQAPFLPGTIPVPL